MKIQINGQQLRFRIDEDALAELLDSGHLTRSSHLSPGVRLVQRIVLGDAPDGAALQVEPGAWSLRLPRADLLDYVARLPCRDALAYVLPGGAADAPLYVGIEVDVRDSVRRRGPRRRGTGTAPDPTAE
ncbi:MAG TPA: hypothetical protein PLI44_01315 [Chiayiivirga sp.]|uniref:Uncharacterized protein n=1 Tax=Denitratimonas tolerans TaxID=1338420 RepID=A0AAW9R9T8_9GAMM|nr:hypothetical protein [Xanthomonadaceae bacterium]MDX9764310.1 hypothetical protein [Chiayiivirga sp.]MEB2315465.1 hypothetical protein [Xanthomonadaceae bacterium]HMN35567.1 hypothetical protein [Chiayiivirga sp.]HRN58872.1 hypothetical protein [Chiayiivirga sp.]